MSTLTAAQTAPVINTNFIFKTAVELLNTQWPPDFDAEVPQLAKLI